MVIFKIIINLRFQPCENVDLFLMLEDFKPLNLDPPLVESQKAMGGPLLL